MSSNLLDKININTEDDNFLNEWLNYVIKNNNKNQRKILEMMGNHELSRGVNKNEKKTFEWYLKSAENGNKMAQNNVGDCYVSGIGTDENETEAFEWSIGTAVDDEVVFEWYLKSAIGGCAIGQYNLGDSYYYGVGTDVNVDKAIDWYKKALDNGFYRAKLKLDTVTANSM
ncbi:hypothetical protein C1645_812273 [Glomus cerebriforme]|uniref:Uncharacterized protein n=1 Tax=Glomus cerebriforme TaxID=658196 RepID=A0A397TLH5_9GLOM|nr:hypothetical protein C1645_812273 [Glomus cerebriforme]